MTFSRNAMTILTLIVHFDKGDFCTFCTSHICIFIKEGNSLRKLSILGWYSNLFESIFTFSWIFYDFHTKTNKVDAKLWDKNDSQVQQ